MDKTGLKKLGFKITQPRLRVLEALKSAPDRHQSAEDIHRFLSAAGMETSLASIYRVLSHFESAGLVIRHHFESDHSVFELDDKAHHDHLVCTQCGLVVEFTDSIIEERQLSIAKERGFTIQDHALSIFGLCSDCAKKPSA